MKPEDTDVADRDPERIKQDIDQARDQLAATVDSLTERANPRRLADDLKTRVVTFVTQPVVLAALAGITSIVVIVTVRRFKRR